MGRLDGDLIDLVEDKGREEWTVRGSTETGDLDEITPYRSKGRRISVED